MKNSILEIENLMKKYLANEPAISRNETDAIAKEVVVETTKNLSENMLKIIVEQINYSFCKAMFKDYLVLKNNKILLNKKTAYN
jgi:hypothetical protein